MVPTTIVNGVYKPSYNWGGPHCMFLCILIISDIQKMMKYSNYNNDRIKSVAIFQLCNLSYRTIINWQLRYIYIYIQFSNYLTYHISLILLTNCIYIYSPGQWPRKTWPLNFDDQDQFFWLVSVSILMALSCIMKSFLVIYDISCVYDHIWQLYLRAISSNNPPGNDINFRISTSPRLPNIQSVVYSWVPRAILPLGIQGRNHHERMAYELSGAQNCYREPSVNRAWTDPLKTYYYWQKTYYYHEPSVSRAWNLRKTFFKFGKLRKKISKNHSICFAKAPECQS